MKKKKALIWITSVLAILAAVGGAVVILGSRKPSEPVYVYRIGDGIVGMSDYYESGNEMYGNVTSDHVQTVYLSETQTVLNLLVREGQPVRKGDILFVYDTTLTELQLQRKDLSIQQMKVDLKTAQNELQKIKGYKPIYYHPTKPTTVPPTTADRDFIDIDVAGKDYVIYDGTGLTFGDPLRCWMKTRTGVTEELIEKLFEAAGGQRDMIYVIFQHTMRNSGYGKITEQYGVAFTREEVIPPTVPPDSTDPSDPSVPSVPPESSEPLDPSETTGPSEPEESTGNTDPSEGSAPPTDPEESQGSEEDTVTIPLDPIQPIRNSTAESVPVISDDEEAGDLRQNYAEPEKRFTYTMQFYDPVAEELPPPPPKEEIDWNSGFTSSEIADMRKEKEEEIKSLTFEIKMAEAEFRIMKKEASDGKVRAEMDGVVMEVNGQEPSAEVPFLKVSDGGNFVIEGVVSELYLDTIELGQQVQVVSWDSGENCMGTVTEIGSYPVENSSLYATAENVSSYPYRVEVDGSANLRDGYYVGMTLQAPISEANESGLYLSTAFVREENGSAYVFVRNQDGLLEKRQIRTGRSLWDTYVQIQDGLTEDDCVAFPYGKNVVDGAPTKDGDWDTLNGV